MKRMNEYERLPFIVLLFEYLTSPPPAISFLILTLTLQLFVSYEAKNQRRTLSVLSKH